jgi:hypothetical protein
MSPRSFGRPVPRLLRMNASGPMKSTSTSPQGRRVLFGHASANVRPVSSVRMSIRPLMVLAMPVSAQEAAWKPEGPVPRATDGKPDLSGVWWLGREPALEAGPVGSPRSGPAPTPAPGSSFASLYTPEAAARAKTLGDKDDPALRCIPSVGGPPTTNIVPTRPDSEDRGATPGDVSRVPPLFHRQPPTGSPG